MNEADIAQFLLEHPDFFERHAEILAQLQLTSPVTGQAVPLHARQLEVLRAKFRNVELRETELIRNARHNDTIQTRLHRLACALLAHRDAAKMPQTLCAQLESIFGIEGAAIRLWDVNENYRENAATQGITSDLCLFAKGLSAPYCGANRGFEAMGWLTLESIGSCALVPLHRAHHGAVCGLLVLGASDPRRFEGDMQLDFLIQLGELAESALASWFEIPAALQSNG